MTTELADVDRAVDTRIAAQVLGWTQQTVRTKIHEGAIRAVRLPGGRFRIPVTELDRLLRGD